MKPRAIFLSMNLLVCIRLSTITNRGLAPWCGPGSNRRHMDFQSPIYCIDMMQYALKHAPTLIYSITSIFREPYENAKCCRIVVGLFIGLIMAVIKIVLKKDKKQDGTYPLAIRVTKDRKSTFIYLEHSIKESDWDNAERRVKKSHPNSTRLNMYLLKKLAEANDQSIELETDKKHVSASAVKAKVKPKTQATFFPQADLYLQQLKEAGKYNRYTPDKSRIQNFKNFLKHDTAFQDITIPILERFKSHVENSLKQSERSAVNHLVVIRSVFSFAIAAAVVDEKYYPFGKGKVAIKFPDTSKVGLNEEDIEALENVALEGKANHARNLWLFSYYFAGMRISDVLRLTWADFQNHRLHYTMGKNKKGGSLKIPDKAEAILSQYKEFKVNENDLVFPELKGVDLQDRFIMERTIAFKVSAIDKVLKNDVAKAAEINKKLTMHISRHTFAQLAGEDIDIRMLQKLYRHTNIATTIGYQSNFIHKEADDALDMVLNKKNKTFPS